MAGSETRGIFARAETHVAEATPRQLALFREKVPDHIPVTVHGLPDIAAMKAAGMDAHVAEYDRRVRALAEWDRHHEAGVSKGDCDRIVAGALGVSARTVRNWRALAKAGHAGLVPAWGNRRGTTTLPYELQREVKDFYLDPRRPTMAQTYRHVVTSWYAGDGRELPHRTTVERFIREHVKPIEKLTFREGRRAYRAHAEPKVTRELPAHPNEVWCADHRIWDVMVLDETKAGKPRPRRPWVTMIVDVHSAAIVGYRICRTPSAVSVAHALRMAIGVFGLPEKFVRDNGREFTAKRLGGKPERLRNPHARDLADSNRWPACLPEEVERSGIWQILGVELITALPYHPWSKPIESIFHAFSRQWENLLPGWTGRDARARPEILAKHMAEGKILRWSEFEHTFDCEVGHWNVKHVCGDRDRPPFAYYEGHVARVPSPDTLAFLLQDVRKGGRVTAKGVQLGGRHYWSDELAIYVGDRVDIRWDPGDPKWAFAYTSDDRVIALQPLPTATWAGFNEANAIAKRGARIQRAYLAERHREIAGACDVEGKDPTGAFRTVAARIRREQMGPIAEGYTAEVQQKAIAEAAEPDEEWTTIYERDPELRRIRELRRKLGDDTAPKPVTPAPADPGMMALHYASRLTLDEGMCERAHTRAQKLVRKLGKAVAEPFWNARGDRSAPAVLEALEDVGRILHTKGGWRALQAAHEADRNFLTYFLSVPEDEPQVEDGRGKPVTRPRTLAEHVVDLAERDDDPGSPAGLVAYCLRRLQLTRAHAECDDDRLRWGPDAIRDAVVRVKRDLVDLHEQGRLAEAHPEDLGVLAQLGILSERTARELDVHDMRALVVPADVAAIGQLWEGRRVAC